jgi:hypothetical protein
MTEKLVMAIVFCCQGVPLSFIRGCWRLSAALWWEVFVTTHPLVFEKPVFPLAACLFFLACGFLSHFQHDAMAAAP